MIMFAMQIISSYDALKTAMILKMRQLLPANHPNIDELFENSTRVLPDWHIKLTDLLFVSPMEKISGDN